MIEESFNSDTTVETSENVHHESLSQSDLSVQLTTRDHINTTSDGAGIENSLVNSIEIASIENDDSVDSNEPLDVSVNDEESITETNRHLVSDECDPLAEDAAELNDHVINEFVTSQAEENQTEATGNLSDSAAYAVVKVEDGSIIGRSGFPKPLGMAAEKTIKRENDKMSTKYITTQQSTYSGLE